MSNVKNVGHMFRGASAFNQPIGEWDLSSVSAIRSMFQGAIPLIRPLAIGMYPLFRFSIGYFLVRVLLINQLVIGMFLRFMTFRNVFQCFLQSGYR